LARLSFNQSNLHPGYNPPSFQFDAFSFFQATRLPAGKELAARTLANLFSTSELTVLDGLSAMRFGVYHKNYQVSRIAWCKCKSYHDKFLEFFLAFTL
jgi:hypothetical protein